MSLLVGGAAALAAALVAAAPVAAQTTASVTTDTVEAERRLTLEPFGRIGTVGGPIDTPFGSVSSLHVDLDAGEVYVGDRVSSRVSVFGTDGAFRRAWGRSGEGPGEFGGGALGVGLARDTVTVSDISRLHAFTREGEVLETRTPEPLRWVSFPEFVAPVEGGWIAMFREVEPDQELVRRVYRVTFGEGIVGEPVFRVRYTAPGVPPLFDPRGWVVPHRGGFLVSDPSAYAIEWRTAAGALRAVLRFSDEPVPAVDADFERFEAAQRVACEESEAAAMCRPRLPDYFSEVRAHGLPDARPVVGELLGSADGWILVQRADLDPTPFTDGDETTWDLVSDDGRWLGRLEFPPRVRPRWLGAGQVWGVELDAFDVPTVVGFRIRGVG